MLERKKGAGDHVLIGSKRFRDSNLTLACNRGLQTTPFRNSDSGLPKEAYIDMSNFCANAKVPILGNLRGHCLFFQHFMIKKSTLLQ